MRLYFASKESLRLLKPDDQDSIIASYAAAFGPPTITSLSGPAPTAPRKACLLVTEGAVLVVDVFDVVLYLRKGGDKASFVDVCEAIITLFGQAITSRCLGVDYTVKNIDEFRMFSISTQKPGNHCKFCDDEIPWERPDLAGDDACRAWWQNNHYDYDDEDPRPSPYLEAAYVSAMIARGLRDPPDDEALVGD